MLSTIIILIVGTIRYLRSKVTGDWSWERPAPEMSEKHKDAKPGDRITVVLPKAVGKRWATEPQFQHLRCRHRPDLGQGRTWEITIPEYKPSWYSICQGNRNWRWTDKNPTKLTWVTESCALFLVFETVMELAFASVFFG